MKSRGEQESMLVLKIEPIDSHPKMQVDNDNQTAVSNFELTVNVENCKNNYQDFPKNFQDNFSNCENELYAKNHSSLKTFTTYGFIS